MKNIEYKIEHCRGGAALSEEQLNRRGQEGWELIDIRRISEFHDKFYFKRDVTDLGRPMALRTQWDDNEITRMEYISTTYKFAKWFENYVVGLMPEDVAKRYHEIYDRTDLISIGHSDE